MNNANFRNYNISAKVTAFQKKVYSEQANKEGISLSEWIGSVLDLYIQKHQFKTQEQKKISRTNYLHQIEKLEKFNEGAPIYHKPKNTNIKLVSDINPTKQITQLETERLKSLSNDFKSIGILAFMAAFIFK